MNKENLKTILIIDDNDEELKSNCETVNLITKSIGKKDNCNATPRINSGVCFLAPDCSGARNNTNA